MVSATKSPILVSVDTLPADQADLAEVILETSKDGAGGVLTLAKAIDGAGWSRKFAFERISLGGVETRVIKPGAPAEFRPLHVEPAPTPAPVKEPELPIVSRFVYPKCGFEISDTERARWPDHGWLKTPRDVIEAVESNMKLGKTEIVFVFDERGGDARPEVSRIETLLQTAGLAKFATVTASEKRLLPPW